jgi:hypothetical protein
VAAAHAATVTGTRRRAADPGRVGAAHASTRSTYSLTCQPSALASARMIMMVET